MFRDMYELYPDLNINVRTEQQLLLEHDLIIWQHPFYWYSCPPLMKQWIDLVLEFGWAYGPGGDKLTGKWIMNALTSGGGFDAYQKEGRNRFTYRELLSPFDQTAVLCKMIYLPPFIVPAAPRLSALELEAYASRYAETIRTLQDPGISLEEIAGLSFLNERFPTP